MSHNTNIASFLKHLQQEITWLRELNVVLAAENEALRQSKFDDLEQLSVNKQILSEKLEKSASDRVTLVNGNIDTTQNTFEGLIKQCTPDESLMLNQLNAELAEQLVTCRDLNAVNGQVISSNLVTREEMVNILTGNQLKNIGLYNAEGNMQSASDGGHHQEA